MIHIQSPDHCSSDEYEDYGRISARRSDHRQRRSESRRERSRSREPHHRSHDSDEGRHRHRHRRSGRSERSADDELEEGQCPPEEMDEEEWPSDQCERREETPNSTIMLRGLGSEVVEDDVRRSCLGFLMPAADVSCVACPQILAEVTRHGLHVKDIRLMRHKETGNAREWWIPRQVCL